MTLHLPHGKDDHGTHSAGVSPMGGSVGTSSSPWGSAMPWPFGGGNAHRAANSFGSYSRSQVMVCKDEQRYEVSFLENEGPSSLARAKLLGALDICEAGACFVEKGSIYGAAILMPQLARSMNWHRLLTIEAFRSFLLIGVSIFLQVSLLVMLARKESVYDTFAGQMFLCDLGAGCIQGQGTMCTGPSGTEITPPRLYSFDIWSTRLYVRESLKKIFPDKQDDIQDLVDPGEYGLESYWCRLLCCILFVMSMLKEATNIIGMGKVLYYPPTHADSWLGEGANEAVDTECPPKTAKAEPQKRDAKEEDLDGSKRGGSTQSTGINRKSWRAMKSAEELTSTASAGLDVDNGFEEDWLDSIDLRIAGMPLMWKADSDSSLESAATNGSVDETGGSNDEVINAVAILLPKILVWKLTVQTGITFLMETASISDLVVNSIALTFILSIDEMICETLTSQSTLSMLSRCKDYPLFDPELAQLSEEEIASKYGGEQLEERLRVWDILAIVFPTRLVCVVVITFYFVWSYYHQHCTLNEDAEFLPNSLYPPKNSDFSIFNAVFPDFFPIETVSNPSWTMPHA